MNPDYLLCCFCGPSGGSGVFHFPKCFHTEALCGKFIVQCLKCRNYTHCLHSDLQYLVIFRLFSESLCVFGWFTELYISFSCLSLPSCLHSLLCFWIHKLLSVSYFPLLQWIKPCCTTCVTFYYHYYNWAFLSRQYQSADIISFMLLLAAGWLGCRSEGSVVFYASVVSICWFFRLS